MKLIYLGADVPSNRIILEKMGVQNVGVSFWRLTQRGLPKKGYLFSNYFSPFMKIHLHPGLPANAQISREDLFDFMADYEEFIAHNIEQVESFLEIDHPILSLKEIEDQRIAVWDEIELNHKFIPTWRMGGDFGYANELCQRYHDVAIHSDMIEEDTTLAAKVRNLRNAYDTDFHAIASAKPDNLRQVPVATASTMSWLSPMMRGETIVWDGRRLVRYPKKMKEQARQRYAHIYDEAGLDFDKIMDDDAIEVSKLALWSYEKFEEWFNLVNNNGEELYDNSGESDVVPNAETTPSVPDNKPVHMRKLKPRNPDEKYLLPVFGVEYSESDTLDENGNPIPEELKLKSSGVSLRQCNTCFVAANCPAFRIDSECAFNLPVELKTKEQLTAFLTAILEMQGQRVAFARFSEEMNGGYPDPNVSQEIDRMFKLIKAIKDLESSKEYIQITAERQAGPGVLSQLFGSRAQNLTQLPDEGYSETETTRIIQQSLEE